MNTQWLRKQAISFLDSKKSDPDLMDMLGQLKEPLATRGFTHEDFSKELRVVNNERAEAKKLREEADKAAQEQQEQETRPIAPEPQQKRPEPRREPDKHNSDTVRSPSGTKINSGRVVLDRMMDEAVRK